MRTGRLFYKISVGGQYRYSILFSNIIDSTYADGSASRKNLICNSWTIHRGRIGKCVRFDLQKNLSDLWMDDTDGESDISVADFREMTFDGKLSKEVQPGEFFSCDPVLLDFQANEYLCLELTFSGTMIPYHEETLLPVFIQEGASWRYAPYMPFAAMIGCDRNIKKSVVYLGDSITQGIGTKPNTYLHWSALLSEKIGYDYSYWNLGIGYARANDAASDGAWLYKAKQGDIIFVEFGVNDILQGRSFEQIGADLFHVVTILKHEEKKVILQTLPPFDYDDSAAQQWARVNQYIKKELKGRVDFLFDNVLYLGQKERPHFTRYSDHPNEEGSRILADAFYEQLIQNNIF